MSVDQDHSSRFSVLGAAPLIAAAILLIGGLCWRPGAHAQVEKERATNPRQAVVWIIDDKLAEPLHCNVGDIVQFSPFSTPLIPRFLDAELKARLSGDVTLDPIGTTSVDAPDGKERLAYFFRVRRAGESIVNLHLQDTNEQPMPDFVAEYRVNSTRLAD